MKFILKTKPQGKVLGQYIQDRSRISIITGPLGSGKTFASCERIVKQCSEQKYNRQGQRKSRVYCVRNTYSDLFSTTIKDFLDLFEHLGKFSKGSGIQPPNFHMLFKLPDKTTVNADIVFIALDRPQAVKKLRGSQLTFSWLNEIKELPKAVLDMLDFRIGRYPSAMDGGASYFGIMGDTNQVDDDHWLYELAEVEKPKGWTFFTQPGGLMQDPQTKEWIANPEAENLNNLRPGYYTEGKEGKAESWIRVNLANQYGTVEDGRPVYREQWNEQWHINESIAYNTEEPLVVGLDFGLTPSAIFLQPAPRGTVNVLDEIVSFDLGIKQFAETLLWPFINASFPDAEIAFIGDPAGNQQSQTDKQTVFDELAEQGIVCEASETNELEVRLEAVRYFLLALRDGRAALQVHPNCSMLRKGFNGGYKFRRLQVIGEERFTDMPAKNKYSHIHDALQYACMEIKGRIGISEAKKKALNDVINKYRQTRMVI